MANPGTPLVHRAGRRPPTALALVTAGTLAIAAIACSAPVPTPADPSPGGEGAALEPKRGGYLRHTLPYSALNIDPYTTDDATGYQFISPNWYEGLVSIEYEPGKDWRIENKPIPWLAESWKLEDENTYLFTLRKGVTFHNGDPMTADDVVWSFNRFVNPDPAEKLNPNVSSYMTNVAAVTRVDDYTVRLVTKQPDVDMLINLAARSISVLPKKFAASGGDLTKEAVGTGPFKLVSYKKDGEGLAVRNEKYWQSGRPYMDGVKMALRVDDTAMQAAFSARQTDILTRNDKNQFLPIQMAVPDVQYDRIVINSNNSITLNLTRPPFDDIRVRRALHLALDRQEMNEFMTFGEGVLSAPLVQAGKTGWTIPQEELLRMPGYRQPKDQDIAEAKRLMREAGFPDGFKTTISFAQSVAVSPPTAEAAHAQWKKNLNMDITLIPMDNATRTERRRRGEYDLNVDSTGYLDKPAVLARSDFHSSGLFAKAAGFNDPELDRMIDAQGAEADPVKRGQIFIQIQRHLLDKLYVLPVPQTVLYAIWQPWVHDWVGNMGSRQTVMNPGAIWMDVDAAPADRRTQ